MTVSSGRITTQALISDAPSPARANSGPPNGRSKPKAAPPPTAAMPSTKARRSTCAMWFMAASRSRAGRGVNRLAHLLEGAAATDVCDVFVDIGIGGLRLALEPHCGTSCSIQAFCTLCSTPFCASPSIVVICLPTASLTGSEHERTASPLICTVQAPHWEMPQPYLVPVRPTFSRITHKRGVSGATSRDAQASHSSPPCGAGVALTAMLDLPGFLGQHTP